MTRLLTILTLITLASCGQGNGQSKNNDNHDKQKGTDINIAPFELTVYNSDYSSAYSLQYTLTDKKLEITFHSELVGGKDSILFKTVLHPNDTLKKLSNINIDSLKKYYSNNCIQDGSQLLINLKKDNKSKRVQLSNYYQADIGLAIELINSLTPNRFEIWYDKATLVKELEDCK